MDNAKPKPASAWTLLDIADDIARQQRGEPSQYLSAPLGEDEAPDAIEVLADIAGQSLQGAADLWQSVGGGIAKAGFETADFLLGEPAEADKTPIRREVQARTYELGAKSPANALATGVSQFATGMLGAGKLMAPIKSIQKLRAAGRTGQAAYEIGRGAMVGAVAIDPHEERLSNLIEDYPALANPMTRFLAASPDDTDAEGRFKNALEGIGLDLAIVGVFTAAAKAFKTMRGEAGTTGGATQAELEAAFQQLDAPAPADTARSTYLPNAVIAPKKGAAASFPGEGMMPLPSGAGPVDTLRPAMDLPSGATPPEAGEADMSAILTTARSDFEAIQLYGTREDALANGYRFASSRLPWQKLSGSEEVRTFIDAAAVVSKSRLDALKGGDILSDPQVRTMVNDRARLYGEDPADLLGMLATAGRNATTMAADMEAAFLISNRMLQDVYETSLKVRNGILDEWGGDLSLASADLKRQTGAAIEALGAATSMRAAAGRSLRRLRGGYRITPEALQALGKLDGEKLAEVLYSTQGDPRKLVEVANPSLLRRAVEEGVFSLTNSLLWTYPTHLVNLTTNAYLLAARPTEKLIGGLALGAKGRPVVMQAKREYVATVAALGDAWEAMGEAFKRGDSRLRPHGDEYLAQGHTAFKGLKPVHTVGDLLENGWRALSFRSLVGLPTRSLGAVDEFMKTLRYRAVIQAKAAVEADMAGLTGTEARTLIERRMAEAFDADGRGTNREALREAETATFQQDLLSGTAGATVLGVRQNHPALGFILPFVKTPINVLRYGWKMTPGLNLLQTEYRQMIKGELGVEAQAHAIGQMALASVFMALAANLALTGRLTGGGPEDPEQLTNLRAKGWQPYSIVFDNEDGTKTFFPLGRFDPVGLPMGIVADLVEAEQMGVGRRDGEAGRLALGLSLAKNFSDKTFLLSINQVLRAATEPETHLGKVAGGMVSNTIPFSSLLRSVNPDPHLREARTFVDQIRKGIPGYSAGLPPRRDAFGEPIAARLSVTSTYEVDLVESEHNRMILETGRGINPPTPHRNGVDLRGVTLSDGRNAYDLFQELATKPGKSRSMKASLAKLIQSKNYERLVDGPAGVKGTKLDAIAAVVSDYREAAFKMMMKKYPELRAQVHQRQLQVKSALSANRAKAGEGGGPMSVEKMLKDMGY